MPGMTTARQKKQTEKRWTVALLEEKKAIHISLRDYSWQYQIHSGICTVRVGHPRYSIDGERIGRNYCFPHAGSQATGQGTSALVLVIEDLEVLTSGWPNSFPSKFRYPSPPRECTTKLQTRNQSVKWNSARESTTAPDHFMQC